MRFSVKIAPGVRVYGGRSRRRTQQQTAFWMWFWLHTIAIACLIGGTQPHVGTGWLVAGIALTIIAVLVDIALISTWQAKRRR
jgi:membrane protein insertase Oxa1/YidC/SpoIIIJ